ncbi:hypothetical protein [Nafulsella turpanensis]|uniref:hypothetical protein n=1 Tax=Nafulsella turpanensis TaxID=1265690 RepID=UPI00034C6134|nr:hypothetical protein [Nafulsella turpanensis]
MLNSDELSSNKTDLLASLAKSSVGIVPFAGPLLSEIVGSVIPNQRIDRLAKYIKVLDEKLSSIPVEKITKLINNEEFIDLIEEGFFQASRAISDDRRKYIASIVSNGIADDSIELLGSKYLLKILEELNDVEIIWLKSYYNSSIGGDQEFMKKHENVLTPIYATADDDETSNNKSAIQKSYKEHLERIELIKRSIRFNRSTGLPEYDKNTGEPKISYRKITPLGKLLLDRMGLIGENKE